MMTNLSHDATRQFQRASTALHSNIEGGCVVMDIHQGRYYTLNDTAAAIWNALEAPASEREIVDRVGDMFSVDENVCREKVGMFLEQLLERHIVSVADTSR